MEPHFRFYLLGYTISDIFQALQHVGKGRINRLGAIISLTNHESFSLGFSYFNSADMSSSRTEHELGQLDDGGVGYYASLVVIFSFQWDPEVL